MKRLWLIPAVLGVNALFLALGFSQERRLDAHGDDSADAAPRGLMTHRTFATDRAFSTSRDPPSPLRVEREFRQTVWTREHGLPGNSVRAVCQSGDGYVWIATDQGLARFDGARFSVFTRANCPVFETDDCTALAEDRHGDLWIGTARGLLRRRGTEWRRFTTGDNLNHDHITTLRATSTGDVWIGTEKGPARFADGRMTSFPPRGTVTNDGDSETLCFYEDHQGRVWIGSLTGLQRWDPELKRPTDVWISESSRSSYVNAMAEDVAGNLWLMGSFLWKFNDEGWNSRTDGSSLSNTNIAHLFTDQRGTVWLITRNQGIVTWLDGRVRETHGLASLPDNRILCMHEDREGNFWLGTQNSGLVRLRPARFGSITSRQGLGHDLVWTLCQRRDGSLWFGTEGGIRYAPAGGSLCAYDATPPLDRAGEGGIRVLYEDRRGVLWAGINAANHVIRTVIEDRSGSIWVGSQEGLYRWDGQAWSRFTTDHGLPENDVRALLEDRRGALWLGTARSGVCRLIWDGSDAPGAAFGTNATLRASEASGNTTDTVRIITREVDTAPLASRSLYNPTRPGSFTRFTSRDGLSNDRVTSLHEDSEGVLWIGTEAGLNRVSFPGARDGLPDQTERDPGSTQATLRALGSAAFMTPRFAVFTRRQGLAEDSIRQILDDHSGQLWIGTTHGILRLRKAEFTAVAEGRASEVHCIVFDESDGLPSGEVTGGKSQPGAIRAQDGHLWFPTTKGAVVVDPAMRSPTETGASPHIQSVRVNGETVFPATTGPRVAKPHRPGASPAPALHLPPGSGHFMEITYSAPEFTAPERLQFKYRLTGSDPDWRSVGNERVAHYTHLHPGSYEFRVIVRNHHGTWSNAGAEFAFSIAPYFWQTWWFHPLWISAVALSGLGIHLRRLGHLLNRQERVRRVQLTAQRAAISADLHDAAGASLCRIVRECEQGEHSSRDPRFAAVAATAREALEAFDQAIWLLKPGNETLDRLALRCIQATERLFRAADVRVRCLVPEDMPPTRLTPAAQRDILFVVREAAHNVVKHARATEARLELTVDPIRLVFVLMDNGVGFDPARVAPDRQGLANLRRRAGDWGGTLAITSTAETGTRLEIDFPLEAITEASTKPPGSPGS